MPQLFYRLIYNRYINFALRNLSKSIHKIIPKSLRIPPSGRTSISSSRGKIFLETNQTSYLTQLTFWNGYLNFEYTKLFIDLIKSVGSFWDVGSNIGYYSLIAAKENPNIKVTAFEPAQGPLHFLKRNVLINNLTNITIEPIALSDQNGQLTFYEVANKKYTYLDHNLAGEGNAGSKTTGRHFKKTVVESLTINDYVQLKSVKELDLLKIDTEGTEHLIFSMADEVLFKMKPIIICETLFNKNEAELEQVMKNAGYEFYNHTPLGLQKTSSLVRKVDNGVLNCFFVHPTKTHLINKYIAEAI